ncbi:response regulator [Pseudodesulfovibrio sp.]|uniref:response regulator n=1 Tax=unclassified Pseudodesulfovibrio TaxID=2661612 RepID=UPI003B008844
MKILVAEDEYVSRYTLTTQLIPYGEVDVAVNGLESVQAVKAALDEGEAYDLIFMDIIMPEMDGLEATKKIRELEREYGIAPKDEAKIIMTSALRDAKTVIRAYHDGQATEYLPKPWKAATIHHTLSRIEGAR